MKILVTGSRYWDNYTLLWSVLELYLYQDLHPELIHGGARGADTWAAEFARQQGWIAWRYLARWDLYGRAAGSIRNQEMLDNHPDIAVVLAFPLPGSIGTWDMVDRARRVGVPRVIIRG